MRRMGWILGIAPDRVAEYRELHAAVWPDVLSMIATCGIRNYTIYLREPENLLFAHFEYHGGDWEADAARMAADPVTRDWWALCSPCQRKLDSAGADEWWAPMEEVFHTE
ncbi:L-rhamnose mutarotase [Palleronia aestuarii]|uniref:L-rhamnose mutarotase n=1 Tax=Palleronia aestuarii TaxID=568105 RepID=A0A2W7N9I9_9RHOB|nr:L-rhamnose mutarotase [Palleronia aestuarii]PZX17075.1 L-rhamnose mutarotase [Palleronia aestuarii]